MIPFDLDKLRQQDEAEWGLLIGYAQGRLQRFAWRYFDRDQDAVVEDVLQETLEAAYDELCCKGTELQEGGRYMETWLHGICRNRCLAHLRQLRRPVPAELEIISGQSEILEADQVHGLKGVRECLDCLPTPESRDLAVNCCAPYSAATVELLVDCLNRCSPALRSVLILRYIGELKYQEIAHMLTIPLGTVKKRLHVAIPSLRSCLEKKDVQPVGRALSLA
ncbi:MAG: sigma-70 family RNA polymerase sigma factor [Candidatus Latescibacteria bacterium]|nr:sigma-70 family RNA polymerase sigma factor [Candidatus Latescibacterota bacterium]